MSKPILLLGFVALLGFSACEKCADCVCDGVVTFEFSDSIASSTQETLESTYTTTFHQNYPDDSKEICEKRKDLDAAMNEYEAQSDVFTENNTLGGESWSVDGVYTCTCTEQ